MNFGQCLRDEGCSWGKSVPRRFSSASPFTRNLLLSILLSESIGSINRSKWYVWMTCIKQRRWKMLLHFSWLWSRPGLQSRYLLPHTTAEEFHQELAGGSLSEKSARNQDNNVSNTSLCFLFSYYYKQIFINTTFLSIIFTCLSIQYTQSALSKNQKVNTKSLYLSLRLDLVVGWRLLTWWVFSTHRPVSFQWPELDFFSIVPLMPCPEVICDHVSRKQPARMIGILLQWRCASQPVVRRRGFKYTLRWSHLYLLLICVWGG